MSAAEDANGGQVPVIAREPVTMDLEPETQAFIRIERLSGKVDVLSTRIDATRDDIRDLRVLVESSLRAHERAFRTVCGGTKAVLEKALNWRVILAGALFLAVLFGGSFTMGEGERQLTVTGRSPDGGYPTSDVAE